jgi:hypothetical protein
MLSFYAGTAQAAICCHSLEIYEVILLSLLSSSVKTTVSPRAKQAGGAEQEVARAERRARLGFGRIVASEIEVHRICS